MSVSPVPVRWAGPAVMEPALAPERSATLVLMADGMKKPIYPRGWPGR